MVPEIESMFGLRCRYGTDLQPKYAADSLSSDARNHQRERDIEFFQSGISTD